MEDVMDREAVSIDFNNLPEDIWWILFNYLSIVERRKFGEVCKKWYEISRHPDSIFWKRIVFFIKCHRTRSMSFRTMELLKILPQCVSSLKLHYECGFDKCVLEFSGFSSILLKRCPNLEELTIANARLIDTEQLRVINLSNAFSKKLRILILRKIVTYQLVELIFENSYISDIEVFDISFSDFNIDPSFLSQIPGLRELHLGGIRLKEDFFDSLLPVIRKLNILDLKSISFCEVRHILEITGKICFNLTELYVCYNDLHVSDVRCIRDSTVLPQLKVICFRGCAVSYMLISSLIGSRPSLQLIYVGIKYNDPDCNYDLCNSVKVRHRTSVKNYKDECEHD